MPDLSFLVEDARPIPFAASPQLGFGLRVTNMDPEEPIASVALRCQIHLEVTRRRYTADEQAKLFDLFGEPQRWGRTLRNMLWTHAAVNVPAFSGSTIVEVPVACTYDFNVAATKYFYALEDGEVPLCLLFSGTVFYTNPVGALQIGQVSWEREATYRLPVRVWQDMMDLYYPNSAWLCLRRDVFDRLYRYKSRHGIPTWEEALQRLLPPEPDQVRP